ncbi:penicillin acylase family protein [Kordiimonas pumila]|uniref:Penicillin acylase family protein n=1 Tax=Kordiimonas pumila TaxID=2161677 RepID=A0ABV7D4K8_9PROT|nr:penicillin acylase family protein [Kordiimonas pumila]
MLQRILQIIMPSAAIMFSASALAEDTPTATITFTAHGIPHIEAEDMYGLGFGSGYASARTDLCAVADAILTYAGKRSRVYGPAENTKLYIPQRTSIPNAVNDLTIHYSISDAQLEKAKAGMSADMLAVLEGYAAGFNHYVDVTPPATRPAVCRKEGEIPPVSVDDMIRRSTAYAMLLGERMFMGALYAAAPPAAKEAAALKNEVLYAGAPYEPLGLGSNAYAFGAEMTKDGGGLLMANPHYTWEGPERFMQMHLRAPGYNVMGASLLGTPLIGIGFNASLAWTHTVATDAKATLYRLQLNPDNPTEYLMDGKVIPMTAEEVSIDVLGDSGELTTLSHTFWTTEFGPVVSAPGIEWTYDTAFALADPNKSNFGMFEQSLEMGRSQTVGTLEKVLTDYVASPFLNTLAADADGNVLYTNMSSTPAFDMQQLQACSLNIPGASAYFTAHVMDGAKAECRPKVFETASRPGIMPASMKPLVVRRDYVANSNNSHWYTNPDQPLTGYSPLIGREGTQQNARTRLGHRQVQDMLHTKSSEGYITAQNVKDMLFANRNYMAEILVDDLVSLCGKTSSVMIEESEVSLKKACTVLAGWDRRDDVTSVGTALFREFLKRAPTYGAAAKIFWRVQFDPTRPLDTPAGIQADSTQAVEALAKAILALEKAGIALDAPLGDVQFVVRGGKRFPIHGGPDSSVYNVMDMPLVDGKGYTDPVASGATYIAVITFENGAPVADAILATDQTTDETAPFARDGVQAYSEKQWLRLPFLKKDIAAAAVGEPVKLYAKEAQ